MKFVTIAAAALIGGLLALVAPQAGAVTRAQAPVPATADAALDTLMKAHYRRYRHAHRRYRRFRPHRRYYRPRYRHRQYRTHRHRHCHYRRCHRHRHGRGHH